MHDNENIFAAKYVTCLPSVEEIQREITRERCLLEAGKGGDRTRAPHSGRG